MVFSAVFAKVSCCCKNMLVCASVYICLCLSSMYAEMKCQGQRTVLVLVSVTVLQPSSQPNLYYQGVRGAPASIGSFTFFNLVVV